MSIVMATLCFFFKVGAQSQNTQTTVVNASLAGYKAKLVILDFWATSCTPCIAAFPKLELLQKEFAGKVQFVKITSEKKAKAIPFLENIYKDFPSLIPVITDDTIYRKMYPHIYIPHYVWLDGGGHLIGATTGEDVTPENINLVLKTGKLNVEHKKDLKADKPLFLDTNLLNHHEISHYSLLFKGHYSGLGSGVNAFENQGGKKSGFVLSNMQLYQMYQYAISHLFRLRKQHLSYKRQVILLKDSASFFTGLNEIKQDNYTYICNNAEIHQDQLLRGLLDNLNKSTAYFASIEKRKVKCFVLKYVGNTDRLKTKGGNKRNSLFNTYNLKLTNGPIYNLIIKMDELPFINLPIVDETGYQNNIDISLDNCKNLEILANQLLSYGLKLVPTIRNIDMYVLRDKI